MQQWLDFAQGPLFALTFLIMVLGLLRLCITQTHALLMRKGRRLRNAPWRRIAADALSWAVPVRHMVPGTRIFSSFSILLHIGLILVPVFLADHVILWAALLGTSLPVMGYGFADALSLLTIVCCLALLACRTFMVRQRATSQPADYFLLIMILLPFGSGFLASHPALNPLRWDAMMLIHVLSAEALFVTVPFTKLAHVVLFFFDRLSQVHWQLRPGAGDRVAGALFDRKAGA